MHTWSRSAISIPRHRKSLQAILLIFTLLLTVGCGSNKASAQETFISECGYGYAQKPSSVSLACADGGMYVDQINYTDWSNSEATATGTFYANDCEPDCASGTFVSNPVKISISDPKQDSSGKMIFSTLAIEAEKKLFNGTNNATFDIFNEPEVTEDTSAEADTSSSASTPEEKTLDLLSRLNMDSDLWQINEVDPSFAEMSHKRLGLYNEPDYVIECNLRLSGTWLFVYSNESDAYDAFGSDYFFRNSYYSAKLMFDPTTGLFVILHTSVGGTKQCIDSALQQIDYYATD